MTSLTLTLADTSTVTLTAYQVQGRTVGRALAPQASKGSHNVIRARGDHQQQVTALEVQAEVVSTTLALAYSAAYALIEQAESVVNVAWHQGDVDIAALVSASMAVVGHADIRVTLAWLPDTATITPPPTPSSSGSS